jgi:BioD-like phosphotransacetylase family protein
VLAALPEDRVLAAPSVEDIARAVEARWLAEAQPRGSIDRVMIGTVASDAASPYFGARDRKAVVTRYDKTDIQLAALLTDVDLLVLTGGGEPSPYLMDRVHGTREDISVVVAEEDTVDAMRAIEGLYGASRFDGSGKMLRAAELLDEAGCPVTFD